MFGLDPKQARKELESLEEIKSLQGLSETDLKAKNAQIWREWLKAYQEALQKAPLSVTDEVRRQSMNSVNPKFILRNYLLEEAIRAADKDDFGRVNELLQMCYNPFDDSAISEIST